jgi:hypothetical protein
MTTKDKLDVIKSKLDNWFQRNTNFEGEYRPEDYDDIRDDWEGETIANIYISFMELYQIYYDIVEMMYDD